MRVHAAAAAGPNHRGLRVHPHDHRPRIAGRFQHRKDEIVVSDAVHDDDVEIRQPLDVLRPWLIVAGVDITWQQRPHLITRQIAHDVGRPRVVRMQRDADLERRSRLCRLRVCHSGKQKAQAKKHCLQRRGAGDASSWRRRRRMRTRRRRIQDRIAILPVLYSRLRVLVRPAASRPASSTRRRRARLRSPQRNAFSLRVLSVSSRLRVFALRQRTLLGWPFAPPASLSIHRFAAASARRSRCGAFPRAYSRSTRATWCRP